MKRSEFIRRALVAAGGVGIAMHSMGSALDEAERLASLANPHRSIGRIIPAWEVNVAPTLRVKRTLPFQNNMVVDPFILLDHFGPKHVKQGEGVGVPPHPHRGFEPVTFMFDGHVEHKDSLGNTGLLDSGGIQWMTSGRGIVHSEDIGKRYAKQGGRLHGIQLWVNLPKANKMTDPGYQNITKDKIPTVSPSMVNGVKMSIVAGELFGTKGPAKTFTPIMAVMITMEPGQSVEIPVPVNYNAFIQLLDGSITANGKTITGSNLVLFNNDGAKVKLETPAGSKPTDILLLGGKPINEPIVQYGPFVMNSMDEIQQAYADYQAGKMGRIDH